MLVTALSVAPLSAQVTVEVAPFAGYYLPTANFSKTQETATWLPQSPRDLSGAAGGVEARVWFHNALGVQLQLGVANSSIHYQDLFFGVGGTQPEPNPNHSLGAQVQMASAQFIWSAIAAGESHVLWLSAGPAVVHRAGDAYSSDPEFTESYDVGAALGWGCDIPIGRHLHAIAGLNSLLYSVHVDNFVEHHSLERGLMVDMLVHAGLAWRIP
jgi:hypothetical protein